MTKIWKDGLPQVGEECRFEVWESKGCGWTEKEYTCTVDFIGKSNIVISYGEDTEKTRRVEKSYRGGSIRFMPLKTPAEIERERVVELAKEVCYPVAATSEYVRGIDYAIDSLLGAGLLTDKKVKPLRLEDFNAIYNGKTRNRLFRDLIEVGYIIGAGND